MYYESKTFIYYDLGSNDRHGPSRARASYYGDYYTPFNVAGSLHRFGPYCPCTPYFNREGHQEICLFEKEGVGEVRGVVCSDQLNE